MTDKERLLELLARFRVVPSLRTGRWGDLGEVDFVKLTAQEGGVVGYGRFFCLFVFHPEDGSFAEVGVWE